MGITFEWDQKKSQSNRVKHGVTFESASEIFGDALSLTIADPAHSQGEERFVTIGQTRKGELLVVVHADKVNAVRIISARQAGAQERRAYEQEAD